MSNIDFDALKDPFPESAISWRVGATNAKHVKDDKELKGIPLAYIDARDVMERLDSVVGPANWQCDYPRDGYCRIGVRVEDEWIWKSNGAGETQKEAEKGQYSDAFKRAAVLWGIGQYLYGLKNEWVPIKRSGNSFALAGSPPKLPKWAVPGGSKREITYISFVRDFIEQILCIQMGIANKDIDNRLFKAGAEAWFTLDNEVKVALWKAPASGGIFTTKEREVMQSKEFKEAYYGEVK